MTEDRWKNSKPLESLPTDPTRALVELICESRLPFSLVRSRSFAAFVKAVQSHKDWHPPHRTTVSGSELDKLYESVISSLNRDFEDCKYLALTTDGSTSNDGTSYWAVTLSGLDSKFNMHHSILACVPAFANHCGKNLADVIKSVLTKVGIKESRIVAIVTDEGGGAPCISDFFPGTQQIFCAAHILQACLKHGFDNAISQYTIIANVISLAKTLASSYNQSHIVRAEIELLQSLLSTSVAALKQEVATRWLSQLQCLKSVKDNEQALRVWIDAKLKKDPAAFYYHPDTFWPLLSCLIEILQPFSEVTEDFSSESKPTLHLAIDRVLFLQSHLRNMKDSLDCKALNGKARASVVDLLDKLSQALDAKYTNWNKLELAAYFLWPDNRGPSSPTEEDLFKRGQEVVHEMVSLDNLQQSPIPSMPVDPSSSSSSPSLAGTARHDEEKRKKRIMQRPVSDEMAVYLDLGQGATESGLEFWIRVQPQLPRLADLALRVFSVPCSQTASERLFSLLHLICTHLRGRLQPETVNKQLVCAAFIKRRNAVLDETERKARTPSQIAADADRINSLLNTNRLRKLRRASHIESASKWATADLDAILSSLAVPTLIDEEDCEPVTYQSLRKEFFLECGDAEVAEDDFVPDEEGRYGPETRYQPRAKLHEGSSPHPNSAPGVCHLSTCKTVSTHLIGNWKSCIEGLQPTTSMIFGDLLQYVDFLPDSTTLGSDGKQFLAEEFTFVLNKKGKKKFPSGRRAFLGATGSLVQFGY